MVHTRQSYRNFRNKNPELGLEYYAMFWIMQELLNQNQNKIAVSELQEKLDTYCKSDIPLADIIDLFSVEDGCVYSSFQREVKQNKEASKPQRIEYGVLKQELHKANALIKRLEEKIEFLKSKNIRIWKNDKK